jgi:ABC-2 type transport system permease protein
MLRLLNIELHKLRYSKPAKVLTIVYFILITLITLIASYEFDFGNIHIRLADQGIFNFPFIWHLTTYVAGYLKLFLAIIIIYMMTSEYSYRTLKQNLIDGLSKKEFLISKMLTILLFSVISTIFLIIVTLILGYVFSDYTEISIVLSDLEFLFAYFLKLIAFFAFCFFIGVLLKNSAFSIGILVLWWLIEKIIWLILTFIDAYYKVSIKDSILQFFPLEAMSNLIESPIQRLGFIQSAANQFDEQMLGYDYALHWHEILIVIVWTTLFVYWSYALIKRRDL